MGRGWVGVVDGANMRLLTLKYVTWPLAHNESMMLRSRGFLAAALGLFLDDVTNVKIFSATAFFLRHKSLIKHT